MEHTLQFFTLSRWVSFSFICDANIIKVLDVVFVYACVCVWCIYGVRAITYSFARKHICTHTQFLLGHIGMDKLFAQQSGPYINGDNEWMNEQSRKETENDDDDDDDDDDDEDDDNDDDG